MEFILIYEICDFKGFRSKMTNELVSHCQTLSLRAVTVTYLFLLNVYLPYRHIFNKSSVLSTLPLLGIWWYKARVCVCVCLCVCSLSCLTLCGPMDCRLPGSSVHEIFQARILEWVAIPYSRRSSRPRDWTCVSCISCIGRRILYH